MAATLAPSAPKQPLAPPKPRSYCDSFFKPVSLWLTTTDNELIGIMYMVTGVSQPERTMLADTSWL